MKLLVVNEKIDKSLNSTMVRLSPKVAIEAFDIPSHWAMSQFHYGSI
jgi:hypothetical protein